MENWKVIEGFEAYKVSTLGRVKRTKAAKGATVGQLLKPHAQHKGYLLVDLYDGEGNMKTKALHRLVAEAFIPNPLGLPEVNHLGPQSDCRANKLEWRSEAGNNLHRMQNEAKGVSFYKRLGKWVARYSPEPHREVWLGSFNTKAEAKAVRKAAVASIPYVL
jgi:hypothetical protein